MKAAARWKQRWQWHYAMAAYGTPSRQRLTCGALIPLPRSFRTNHYLAWFGVIGGSVNGPVFMEEMVPGDSCGCGFGTAFSLVVNHQQVSFPSTVVVRSARAPFWADPRLRTNGVDRGPTVLSELGQASETTTETDKWTAEFRTDSQIVEFL